MDKPANLEQSINQFIAQERLPNDYAQSIHHYYAPLADKIAIKRGLSHTPIVVGINGAQGTGKSTLSLLLKHLLAAQGLTTVVISIDDLYLTRAERDQLAKSVHPLLKTRGVPGTHDLEMGLGLIAALQQTSDATNTAIPRFDKANDDRHDPAQWTHHQGKVDVIILEGWCVGALPCELDGSPINALESQHDPDGHWRQFVQTQLNTRYQILFDSLDMLVMLKAPSMECIIEWRTLQEHKLAQKVSMASAEDKKATNYGASSAPSRGIMDEKELLWFIMHYERLTRIMLDTLPAHADVVFAIDAQHNIVEGIYTGKKASRS
jgi:D-glycerate 3-kinase